MSSAAASPSPAAAPPMSRSDWLLLGLLSLIWGSSFFLIATGLEAGIPWLGVVWFRLAIGAVTLQALRLALKAPFPRTAAAWADLALIGILANALPFTLIAHAQTTIPSGVTAILNASTPLWTALIGHLATADERLSPQKLAGVLTGFAGVAILVGPAALAGVGRSESWMELLAELEVVAAALCYGIAGILARNRLPRHRLPPIAVTSAGTGIAAVALTPLLLLAAPFAAWGPVAPEGFAAMAALGALSTGIAVFLHFTILARAGAVNASLVTFLVPVTALFLGLAVRGEPFASRHFIGFLVILAGLLLLDGRPLRWLGRTLRPSA